LQYDSVPDDASDATDPGDCEQDFAVPREARQPGHGEGKAGNYVQEKNCDLKHRIPTGDALIFDPRIIPYGAVQ
jgi:hypothetical protein